MAGIDILSIWQNPYFDSCIHRIDYHYRYGQVKTPGTHPAEATLNTGVTMKILKDGGRADCYHILTYFDSLRQRPSES